MVCFFLNVRIFFLLAVYRRVPEGFPKSKHPLETFLSPGDMLAWLPCSVWQFLLNGHTVAWTRRIVNRAANFPLRPLEGSERLSGRLPCINHREAPSDRSEGILEPSESKSEATPRSEFLQDLLGSLIRDIQAFYSFIA